MKTSRAYTNIHTLVTSVKSNPAIDIANIIDDIRDASLRQGYTISALSKRSGVCRSTLSKWFHGNSQRPQVPTLNAVGRVLGLGHLTWSNRR